MVMTTSLSTIMFCKLTTCVLYRFALDSWYDWRLMKGGGDLIPVYLLESLSSLKITLTLFFMLALSLRMTWHKLP